MNIHVFAAGLTSPNPLPLPKCLKSVAWRWSPCPAKPVPPFTKLTKFLSLHSLLHTKQTLSTTTNLSAHFLQKTCPHELRATRANVSVRVTLQLGQIKVLSRELDFFFSLLSSEKWIGKRAFSFSFSLPSGQAVLLEGASTLCEASGVAEGSQNAFIVRSASSS